MKRLKYESVTNVSEKLRNICQVLNVGNLELKNFKQIDDRRLFQVKIPNDKQKEQLLVAKKLKDFEYERCIFKKSMKRCIFKKILLSGRGKSCMSKDMEVVNCKVKKGMKK